MTRTTLVLAPPLQASAPHQREDFRPLTSNFSCTRPTYMTDLWYWVSNLEFFGPKAKTFTSGHFAPRTSKSSDLKITKNARLKILDLVLVSIWIRHLVLCGYPDR
ncbi:hypothetical protein AVEN_86093-1 [Araneus ventricosus]|uniref:Uncharacterized protein n=1 Tax=Araneus ventricosus TaxID=182803 RepID=A0A4Y2LBC4_ARAVE|nr:hypothetical protein AVEN_86093-1 [Araneus ventricosus]